MEIIKGGSLKKLLQKRKKFSDEDASKIIKSLISAVEHVHSKNFVHRDLKPDNILIDDENDLDTIKLADFGLSASFRINIAYSLNEKMGTLLFMAPEQIKNHSYGKRIDMWACGIIMHILITGDHPLYNPQEDNERTFIEKLRNPQWILDNNFSYFAKDFFLKLCNPQPIERYTSDKALKHPWITRDFNSSIPLTQSEQIREFQLETNLRFAINVTLFLSISKLGDIKQEQIINLSSEDLTFYKQKCLELSNENDSLSQRETDPSENVPTINILHDDSQDGQNQEEPKRYSFEINQADLLKYFPDQRKNLILQYQNKSSSPHKKSRVGPNRSITQENINIVRTNVPENTRKRSNYVIDTKKSQKVDFRNDESISPVIKDLLDISPLIKSRKASQDPNQSSQSPMKSENISQFPISQNKRRKTKPVAYEKSHFNLKVLRDSSNDEEAPTEIRSHSKSFLDQDATTDISMKPPNSREQNFSTLKYQREDNSTKMINNLNQQNNSFSDMIDHTNIIENSNFFNKSGTTTFKFGKALINKQQPSKKLTLPQVDSLNQETTNRRVAPSEEWQIVINGPRKRESSLKSYRSGHYQLTNQHLSTQAGNSNLDTLSVTQQFQQQSSQSSQIYTNNQGFVFQNALNLRRIQQQQSHNSRQPTNQSTRTQPHNFQSSNNQSSAQILERQNTQESSPEQHHRQLISKNKAISSKTPILKNSNYLEENQKNQHGYYQYDGQFQLGNEKTLQTQQQAQISQKFQIQPQIVTYNKQLGLNSHTLQEHHRQSPYQVNTHQPTIVGGKNYNVANIIQNRVVSRLQTTLSVSDYVQKQQNLRENNNYHNIIRHHPNSNVMIIVGNNNIGQQRTRQLSTNKSKNNIRE